VYSYELANKLVACKEYMTVFLKCYTNRLINVCTAASCY